MHILRIISLSVFIAVLSITAPSYSSYKGSDQVDNSENKSLKTKPSSQTKVNFSDLTDDNIVNIISFCPSLTLRFAKTNKKLKNCIEKEYPVLLVLDYFLKGHIDGGVLGEAFDTIRHTYKKGKYRDHYKAFSIGLARLVLWDDSRNSEIMDQQMQLAAYRVFRFMMQKSCDFSSDIYNDFSGRFPERKNNKTYEVRFLPLIKNKLLTFDYCEMLRLYKNQDALDKYSVFGVYRYYKKLKKYYDGKAEQSLVLNPKTGTRGELGWLIEFSKKESAKGSELRPVSGKILLLLKQTLYLRGDLRSFLDGVSGDDPNNLVILNLIQRTPFNPQTCEAETPKKFKAIEEELLGLAQKRCAIIRQIETYLSIG